MSQDDDDDSMHVKYTGCLPHKEYLYMHTPIVCFHGIASGRTNERASAQAPVSQMEELFQQVKSFPSTHLESQQQKLCFSILLSFQHFRVISIHSFSPDVDNS